MYRGTGKFFGRNESVKMNIAKLKSVTLCNIGVTNTYSMLHVW